MVRGRTISVGKDPVDLADGTFGSAVDLPVLKNHGPLPVWIGEVGDGYRLAPGESLPGSISLGSSDPLHIVADVSKAKGSRKKDEATSEVDVVLAYNAVHLGG